MKLIYVCVFLMVAVCSGVESWYPRVPMGICRNTYTNYFHHSGYYDDRDNFYNNDDYNNYNSYRQYNGFVRSPGYNGANIYANPFGSANFGSLYGADYLNSRSRQRCDCDCSRYDWVCGNDGLTYTNYCALDCESSFYKPGLFFQYTGACQYNNYIPPYNNFGK